MSSANIADILSMGGWVKQPTPVYIWIKVLEHIFSGAQDAFLFDLEFYHNLLWWLTITLLFIFWTWLAYAGMLCISGPFRDVMYGL